MNNDTLLCPLYVFTAINTNIEPPFRYSLKKFLQVPVHTYEKIPPNTVYTSLFLK